MTYVLGIDSGGTKTIGMIAHASGEIVASAIVGAGNPNIVSEVDLQDTFTSLFHLLQTRHKEASQSLDYVFAGVSGAGHIQMKEKIKRIITNVIPYEVLIKVDDDAIIALYSGTLAEPGIVQISGTGSITSGINQAGKRGRVGGWGHLAGEKGSGYAIGSDAIQAAFASHDGTGEQTMLTDSVSHYFKVNHLPDLIPQLYRVDHMKELVAAITPAVFEAYDEGDMIAKWILHDHANAMCTSMKTLKHALFGLTDNAVDIVLAGGLFNRADIFIPYFEKSFNKDVNRVSFTMPTLPPVAGAIIAAFKTSDHTFDAHCIEKLKHSI